MSTRVSISENRKNYPDIFERVLAEYNVVIEEADMSTESAIIEAGEEMDFIVTDSEAPVTGNVIRELNHLEAITQTSIGVDNIDIETAADEGIPVVRAPYYAQDDVATHALSLLLACTRKVVTYHNSVQEGTWASYDVGKPIHRVAGRTVGLIAFGPIAQRFARRLEGFDVDVVAYDPYVDADAMSEHGVRKVSLTELTEVADHVSAHAPITEETRGMLDADFFEALDDAATVVNTGRGGVIDEDDLLAALESGEIAAAGLDVFAEEPPWGSPLLDREDVVVTPHAAWYSEESIADANESVAADIARLLDGEEPRGLVKPEAGWV